MKMEFSDYAVAFLDIFGFTDFVKKEERYSESSELQKLVGVIEKAIVVDAPEGINNNGSYFRKEIKLECLFISDSIILSAPISKETNDYSGLIAVSIKTIQIAHQVLQMGFLLNGGVAIGKVCRYKNEVNSVQNIFGSGYMDAYKTQNKTAINPRVVFHQSANDILNIPDINRLSVFMKDGDQWIVDLLNPHSAYVGSNETTIGLFNAYREKIIYSLEHLPLGSAQRSKWEWMASFFNGALSDYGYGGKLNGVEQIESIHNNHSPFKRCFNSGDANQQSDWAKPFKGKSSVGRIVPPVA